MLRYVSRSLLRSPGYSASVVIILGLGIGGTAAVFSAVNAILLRPLPYERPEQLFMVRESAAAASNIPLSPDQIDVLSQSFAEWAAIETYDMLSFNLATEDGAVQLAGGAVTPGFFGLLGVRPSLGRLFDASEGASGHNTSALLSHGLWNSRFGADPGVLGREIELVWSATFGPRRDLPSHFTVIGVLPEEYLPPLGGGEVYVPLVLPTSARARSFNHLFPIARLEGIEADAAATAMGQALAAQPPPSWRTEEEQRKIGATLLLLGQRQRDVMRTALWVLLGAMALVLLAACANVANLMLARNTGRQREIAVRLALGASRGRLLRWLLTESTMLAVAGAVLGVALAWGGLRLLHSLQPSFLPRLSWIQLDRSVLGLAMLLALGSGLLFGALPALIADRRSASLRNAVSSSGVRHLGAVLVVVQVSLAVVLTVGAGLLGRSFQHLLDVELGFDTSALVTFEVSLPALRYAEPEERERFHRTAMESIARLRGVRSVGLSTALPMTTVNTAGRVTLPVTANTDDGSASAAYRSVTEGFFESLGVPLLAGRSFERSDVRPSPDIVVVNEAFAERFFPTGEVIGHSLGLAALGIEQAQIIGVVGNVRRRGPERSIYPVVYAPILRAPSYGYAVRLESRTSVAVDALRRAVASVDPTQPITNVRTFESAAERWLGRPQLNSWLMTLFAGLALTVSAFGLLALLLFTTSSRRREIGLRMALGACRDDVLRLVIGDGARLVAAGVALGLLAALGLGRLLSGLLFGIAPSDPISLALAATATLVVALPAMWIPAHRATRVDPMTALRLE